MSGRGCVPRLAGRCGSQTRSHSHSNPHQRFRARQPAKTLPAQGDDTDQRQRHRPLSTLGSVFIEFAIAALELPPRWIVAEAKSTCDHFRPTISPRRRPSATASRIAAYIGSRERLAGRSRSPRSSTDRTLGLDTRWLDELGDVARDQLLPTGGRESRTQNRMRLLGRGRGVLLACVSGSAARQ